MVVMFLLAVKLSPNVMTLIFLNFALQRNNMGSKQSSNAAQRENIVDNTAVGLIASTSTANGDCGLTGLLSLEAWILVAILIGVLLIFGWKKWQKLRSRARGASQAAATPTPPVIYTVPPMSPMPPSYQGAPLSLPPYQLREAISHGNLTTSHHYPSLSVTPSLRDEPMPMHPAKVPMPTSNNGAR